MFNLPLPAKQIQSAFTLSECLKYNGYFTGCLTYTWSCPTGAQKVEVWVIGAGGGGGGGGINGLVGRAGGGGGGGGAGGVSCRVFYGLDIPTSACICLGQQGIGGSAANIGVCATNGTAGGPSSFGSLVHAGGGGGGVRGMSCCANLVVSSAGGAGGTGNYQTGGTGGCSGFFASSGVTDLACPAFSPGGGGAGGGAGSCGGITYCGQASAPGGEAQYPNPNVGIAAIFVGGNAGSCSFVPNGQPPNIDYSNDQSYGGAAGGGAAGRAIQGIGYFGGNGSPGAALVISFF